MRVGIDLGTTYSTVAYFDKNLQKPMIIKNKYGSNITPSVVGFTRDGKAKYGDDAKELQEFNEGDTASFYKREMGNTAFKLKLNDSTYSAEDLSAMFLNALIADMNEDRTEHDKITEAIITVPAYFNFYQREATKRAGESAGLKVLGIVNEPTAAAIAFGLTKDRYGTYLVYDLGGGTFDVTVVRIDKNGIETLGTDGDHKLGGKDWDDELLMYVTDQFNDEYGGNVLDEVDSPYDLLVAVEKLKKDLSNRESASISILSNGNRGRYTVTRDEFNDITEVLMDRTELLCNNLLKSIKMEWTDIDGVLLVGGSTRMTMVHDFVKKMSGKDPIVGINVDEAVAIGAALETEMFNQAEEKVFSIGGKTSKNEFTIGGRAIDEVGLALGGRRVSDVTAHSMGRLQITPDRSRFFNDIMIEINSAIPTKVTKPSLIKAGSLRNGETEIYVLQGENDRPLDNVILEKQVIGGIEATKNKDIIIDVTYEYTLDGMVLVSAVQKDNNKMLTVHSETLPEDMSWTDLDPDSIPPIGPANGLEIVMCLDTSGSMYNSMDKVRDAGLEFINNLDFAYTKVAILEFESYVHQRLGLTDKKQEIKNVLNTLNDGGGTQEPMTKAYQLLSGHDAMRYIVVMTDGEWCGADTALMYADKCRQEGIEIIAMGIGSGINKSFLNRLATTDAILADTHNMVQRFSSIGQAIANNRR